MTQIIITIEHDIFYERKTNQANVMTTIRQNMIGPVFSSSFVLQNTGCPRYLIVRFLYLFIQRYKY
jgi:hypothetical protein